MANTVNGIRYNLRDDIDTLICKLENVVTAYCLDNKPCNIDKIETDLETLKEAFESNDTAAMKRLHNEYAHLFKRYA